MWLTRFVVPYCTITQLLFVQFGSGSINPSHNEPATLNIPSFFFVSMKVHTELGTCFKVHELATVSVVGGPDVF
jgi:hypothetical protein